MAENREIDASTLPARLDALPGVDALRAAAAGGKPAYLVGGAVRDLLLGAERADLDVVVEGDVRPLAQALGGDVTEHRRFSTAAVQVDGLEIDLAQARAEAYERPGALPKVKPAPIAEDLKRRDFTINAMALPLDGSGPLLDPFGGVKDLGAGVLRVLHDRSFVDDPTRALRAARYAARFGFSLDPHTEELLRATDLDTISDDRLAAELAHIAGEPRPSRALKLVSDWGLMELGSRPRLAAAIEKLFQLKPEWAEYANRDTAILLTVAPGEHPARLRARASKLAKHATPGSPAEVQVLAHDHVPAVLVIARAAGASWLDDYVSRLRHVELEIDGYDLIAEGLEGAAIGRGLNAALAAKLDGEAPTAEDELDIALAAAQDDGSGLPVPEAERPPKKKRRRWLGR